MKIMEHFERRAIKKFLGSLSPELKKRYGGTPPYTYKQVGRTIEELKLDKKYSDFAYFVYCSEEEYERYGFHFEEIKKCRGYRDKYYGGYCGGTCGGEFSGTGSGSSGGASGEGTCGGDGGD